MCKQFYLDKGYSYEKIMHMKKNHPNPKPHRRIYTGKVVFDTTTKMHSELRKVFNTTTIIEEDYALPMVVPGPKLHQYIFTVKKMKTTLFLR